MDALNNFTVFTKYTTNENKKSSNYTFKDCILDCLQEMKKPANKEGKNDRTKNEALAST
jgi:hypothetical protein